MRMSENTGNKGQDKIMRISNSNRNHKELLSDQGHGSSLVTQLGEVQGADDDQN
jgi:uncharacterized protein (DUF1786 family)